MPKRRTTPVRFSWEAVLATAIAEERQRRGWSLADMAEKMTAAGCPLSGSAIYKIESARPRRQISLDEAQVFATVLEKPLSDLLTPPEDAAVREAGGLLAMIQTEQTALLRLRYETHRRNMAQVERAEKVRELIGEDDDKAAALLSIFGGEDDSQRPHEALGDLLLELLKV